METEDRGPYSFIVDLAKQLGIETKGLQALTLTAEVGKIVTIDCRYYSRKATEIGAEYHRRFEIQTAEVIKCEKEGI